MKQIMRMWFDVISELAKNAAMRLPPVRSARLTRPRACQKMPPSSDEVERFALFPLRLVEDAVGSVSGAHVMEVGPGDYLASGLAFLAAGAGSYAATDRFRPDYSSARARQQYRALQARWTVAFPGRPWPAALCADFFPAGYSDLVSIYNQPIETFRVNRQFDIVCSFHVGQAVTDIEMFARATADLLTPGGTAVHHIDFGPLGCWARYGDPYLFLRFPDWLWTAMSSQRGIPNRGRYHEYLQAFERANLEVQVGNLRALETPPERSKLARRFQNMPEDSMHTVTATFVCRLRRGS